MYTLKEILRDGITSLFLLLPLAIWQFPGWTGEDLSLSSPKARQPARSSSPARSQTDLPWYDKQRFFLHIQTRLPAYRSHFQQAAQRYGLPWTLLAAQAYQESRWHPLATSPTGVRGLMMLTKTTAADLGITNRLDPRQSIFGGAQYFASLLAQLSKHIPEPDRIWIALAAYNVGLGHIKDAQLLARRLGKNPHSWEDLKTVLPLLARKQYYQTLPYGYARGWEPVQYVKRIRAYRRLLEQHFREV
ncbi:MAG: soluble lytic transglycosylase fused to an ABC-type amino acid-binding protein [Nitrospirae bacterium]|nr:MAG: soluble lytic transglycosylase fused to an ABC-type amino acid-binding protein [Nitrospirota bacterium]